jgi:hypothetical protein
VTLGGWAGPAIDLCSRYVPPQSPPAVPYGPPMPDAPNLRPASRDELTQSLPFALGFNGRKRVHDADETMARVTAERLVEHLERSGYMVMHKPPLGQPGTPGSLAAWIEKATKGDRGE